MQGKPPPSTPPDGAPAGATPGTSPRRFARRLASALAAARVRFSLLWLVFGALVVFAATGIPKVTFDSALLRFFNSDFPAYGEFVDVAQDFASDSNDVIVLIEADDLADPAALGAVSAFLLEMQFVEGALAAFSPLALEVAAADGRSVPLVPFPLPDSATMADRFDTARPELASLRRLMAEDRSAMLAIVPLSLELGEGADEAALIATLRDLAAKAEAAADVRIRLSGYPILRDQLARSLLFDVLILNLIGASVGFIVAATALRSLTLGLLTLPGPLISLGMALASFGHLGIPVTTVSVTLPVLVMILATSDSYHIIFERARQGARDSKRATFRAVRRVAIACLFAAVTTSIAFAALTLSQADIISELGRMGAGLVLVSSVSVLLTQTVVLSTMGRYAPIRAKFARLGERPPSGFVFAHLPTLALARPRAVGLAGLLLLAAATVFYTQAGPRYSVLDSLADNDPLRATFTDIERKVVPISVLQVAVDSQDRAVIGEVEATIANVANSDFTQSVASVLGTGPAEARDLPATLGTRLVSRDGTRALVTLSFRYDSGAQALALAGDVDRALAGNPALAGVEISPATGLPVMTASVVEGILGELNQSLLVAILAVGLLIALWLRSIRIALISLVPNMLPVALVGGWLALSGRGIELANGLALTIAFGVAVDDTLHVLNRIRLTGGFARLDTARLRMAMHEATPVLVTTSTVLILGFGGSAFAETQEVSEFGAIAMGIFALAIFADLLVLPALVAFLGPHSYLPHRKGAS